MLGWDRGAAGLGIQGLKPRRQPAQGLIRHDANRPQRMIGRHAVLGRQIAEQVTALLVVSAHVHAPFEKIERIVVRSDRLVDPVTFCFEFTDCWGRETLVIEPTNEHAQQ
jgi:hypothetical protein